MMKKFQNPDGNLPYLNKDGDITYDIAPAGIAAANKDKIRFFEDYANRYNRFNNKNRTKRILNTVKNDNALVQDSLSVPFATGYYTMNSLNNIKDNVRLGRDVVDELNTSREAIPDRIYLASDSDNNTYTHELAHKLNDSLFPRIRRSRKEKKLLNDAYSLGNFTNPYSKHFEQFTTNTELRDRISSDNNNILGSDLDDVINNMSYDDLHNYVSSTNGYVGSNDYYKLKDGITDAKSAYDHYIQSKHNTLGLFHDSIQGVDPDSRYYKYSQMSKDDYINNRLDAIGRSWKDLTWQKRREWKQNFKNGLLDQSLYQERLNTDKLDAVRKALINVAKLGGKICNK